MAGTQAATILLRPSPTQSFTSGHLSISYRTPTWQRRRAIRRRADTDQAAARRRRQAATQDENFEINYFPLLRCEKEPWLFSAAW